MAANQITSFTFQWIIFCNVFFFFILCAFIASVFNCLFLSSLYFFCSFRDYFFFLQLLLYWWNKIHCIFYEWTVIVNMVELTHTYFCIWNARVLFTWYFCGQLILTANERPFFFNALNFFQIALFMGPRIGICTHEKTKNLFMDLLFTKNVM